MNSKSFYKDATLIFTMSTDLKPVDNSPAKSRGGESTVLEAVLLLLRELDQTQLETVSDTIHTLLKQE